MRRKDREVTNMEEILDIMRKCDVCRIAFFDKEYPYIIPMNFGFSNDMKNLYFHGANVGKKIDLLKANPNIGFEMDCSHRLITGEKACDYTMEFESICGNGQLYLLEAEDKIDALNHLMRQYSKKHNFEYNERYLKEVAVFCCKVNEIYAKRLMK